MWSEMLTTLNLAVWDYKNFMGHHILLDVTRKKHKVLFVLSLFWSQDFDQQPFFCYNKSRWPLWSKHVGCYFSLGCLNCPGNSLNSLWTDWTEICICLKQEDVSPPQEEAEERLYQKIWCFCCISDNLQIPEIRLEIRCTLGLIAIAHYFLILFPLVHKWWHLINRKRFLSQNWLRCTITSTEQKMFRFVPHAHYNCQQKHHCGLYFMGFPTSVLPALRTVRL